MTDLVGVHVAAVVQNVSLADDNRLCKQVGVLLAAGCRVSVITRHDDANAPWRDLPGLTLLEYRAPVDGASAAGHVREYVVSLCRQAPQLVRLHLRERIDVLQVCQPPDLYFPMTAVARRLGVKVLLDQRDLMPETLAQRYASAPARAMQVLHWLERRTQKHVDASVTVNEHLRRRLIDSGGAPDRVRLVRNGPVLDRLDRARATPDLPVPPGIRPGISSIVTWAGKMGRQDRVDDIVKVAQIVVHEQGRDDVGFALIGNGECLDELRGLVDELGLGAHVWFPGWLGELDLYRHLAGADVGVDASLQPEVTPVKAMEYLGVGLPLVAYDVQETRRLAEGAAVLVTPGDTHALARELMTLLDDPDERARLGRVGSDRVRLELAWERQGEVYVGTVAELVAAARSSAGAATRRIRAAARTVRPSGS